MKLFKNFLSLAGGEILCKLLTFAAFARLARIIGPEYFGYVEWAGVVVMCAGLIVDQGFGLYGSREIAKAPARAAQLAAEIVGARFFLALLGYGFIAAIAFGFEHAAPLRNLLLLYGLSLTFAPLLLGWIFQGHDKMKTVALIHLIRQFVFSLVIIFFATSVERLWTIAAAEIAGVAAAAFYGVRAMKKQLSLPLKIKIRFSENLLRQGSTIGLSQMFYFVKMFGPTFIIGFIATSENTGYFAGAMRIFLSLHTFVWLYYLNLLPSFSRAWEQEKRGRFFQLVNQSVRLVAILGLLTSIIWIWLAPFVMMLVYGRDFLPGGTALQWMAGACFCASLSGNYRFGLLAANRQRDEMKTSAFGALLVAVSIPLGYLQFGTGGAAAGLCLAEFGVLIYAFCLARKHLFAARRKDIDSAASERFDGLIEAAR